MNVCMRICGLWVPVRVRPLGVGMVLDEAELLSMRRSPSRLKFFRLKIYAIAPYAVAIFKSWHRCIGGSGRIYIWHVQAAWVPNGVRMEGDRSIAMGNPFHAQSIGLIFPLPVALRTNIHRIKFCNLERNPLFQISKYPPSTKNAAKLLWFVDRTFSNSETLTNYMYIHHHLQMSMFLHFAWEYIAELLEMIRSIYNMLHCTFSSFPQPITVFSF